MVLVKCIKQAVAAAGLPAWRTLLVLDSRVLLGCGKGHLPLAPPMLLLLRLLQLLRSEPDTWLRHRHWHWRQVRELCVLRGSPGHREAARGWCWRIVHLLIP